MKMGECGLLLLVQIFKLQHPIWDEAFKGLIAREKNISTINKYLADMVLFIIIGAASEYTFMQLMHNTYRTLD